MASTPDTGWQGEVLARMVEAEYHDLAALIAEQQSYDLRKLAREQCQPTPPPAVDNYYDAALDRPTCRRVR